MRKQVKVSELELGDKIQLFEDGVYGCATVYRINKDSTVQVIRPYVHVNDVIYTGGLLHYLGWEDFALLPNTNVVLLEKQDQSRLR